MKTTNKIVFSVIVAMSFAFVVGVFGPSVLSVSAAPVEGVQTGPVQDQPDSGSGGSDASDSSSASGLKEGANAAQGDGQPAALFGKNSVFVAIVNTLLFVIGAVAVVMLVYGGIRYTISGGDQKAVTDAKNTILYAVIGIVVAVMAYAIVNFVLTSINNGTTEKKNTTAYTTIVA